MAFDAQSFLLSLVIILLTARAFAEIASRSGVPPVIGELMAGIVLGPSLLGWVEPNAAIHLLAEIGIILLLFEVGLETDIRRLARSGGKSMLVATGGVIFPFVLGFAVSRWGFGLDLLSSLFIGGTLTATSIGITVRVLSELKIQHSEEGQIVLGAAVADDVIGVVLLAILFDVASRGGVDIAHAGRTFAFVAAFFLIAPPLAKLLSAIIERVDVKSELPGIVPTAIVALVLFFAWLAHVLAAPQLLGGFAAGLALSRRFFLPFGIALRARDDFADQIEHQMRPIVHLFTPIFFVMVGLTLNLREIDWHSGYIWSLSALLLAAAVIGKVLVAALLKGTWLSRMTVGVAMVPRGEVGLIFAELGRSSGVLDNQMYAALIIVIALTTLVPPFVLKWMHTSAERARSTEVAGANAPDPEN